METHASIYAQHALLVLVHGGPVQQIGTRETASDHWLHLKSVLLEDFLLAKDSVRFRAKHCKPLCGGRYKGCVDVDSCSQVLTGSESLISIVKSARDSLIWAKVGIIYPHRVHPCFYRFSDLSPIQSLKAKHLVFTYSLTLTTSLFLLKHLLKYWKNLATKRKAKIDILELWKCFATAARDSTRSRTSSWGANSELIRCSCSCRSGQIYFCMAEESTHWAQGIVGK